MAGASAGVSTSGIASTLGTWWAPRRISLLLLVMCLMATVAALKLGDEFWRLLLDTSPTGAIDLKYYHEWTHRWFAGESVHSGLEPAEYLPASYALLWPLVGWLELTPARWLWGATTLGALAWLAKLIVKESGAHGLLERVFVVLMLLSMNAAGSAIGNGQLIVHLLPVLVAGSLMLRHETGGWLRDLLAAALFLATLVKPTVSAPFFWLLALRAGTFRPALLVVGGYAALTVFATWFQEVELWSLVTASLTAGSAEAASGGHADLHIWLSAVGLEQWIVPVSVLALLTLGLWTYHYRYVDLWLLMGVAAVTARLWTYHRTYDDLLILLPMVTLFRIAKRHGSGQPTGVAAGALLGVTLLAMIAPHRLLTYPPPWNAVFTLGHPIVWAGVLGFLLYRAQHEKHRAGASVLPGLAHGGLVDSARAPSRRNV